MMDTNEVDVGALDESPLSDDALLKLESQLCFSLYAAQLTFGKLYRRLLKTLGLTYPQYLVMLVLWDRGPQSVSQLGEALLLSSATLTPLLKRMEKAGWLIRQRSRQDERQVDIVLTEAGKALKSRAADVPKAALCASDISPETLLALKQSLDHLRHDLDAALASPELISQE